MKIEQPIKKAVKERTDPQARIKTAAEKEALMKLAFASPLGRAKLASILGAPVKQYLDYKAIGRNFVVTETIQKGVPFAYWEPDIEEWYATFIGKNGTTRWHIAQSDYHLKEPYELVTQLRVPIKEQSIRSFSVIDRGKERMEQAMELREDLAWIGAFDAAAVASGNIVNVVGGFTLANLARLERRLEHYVDPFVHHHKVPASKYLMNAYAQEVWKGWTNTNLDQQGRVELREKGVFGAIHGVPIYQTELYGLNASNQTYLYLASIPELLAWQPMWKDAEVIPSDDPNNLNFGYVIYSLLYQEVFNNHAIARLRFTATP